MDRGIKSKSKMPPGSLANGFLQVGEAIVDCGACRIINREPPVKVTPKVLAVLFELARHEGETVSRDTLLDTVWAETHPTPDVVKQAMLELRKAFDSGEQNSIIETIPRLGYRLLVKTKYSETLDGLTQPEVEPAGSAYDNPVISVMKTDKNDKHRNNRWMWLLGVVLAASFILLWLRPDQAGKLDQLNISHPVDSKEITLSYRLLTSDLGVEGFPSVSPDGTRVTYNSSFGDPSKARLRIAATDGSGATWLNEKSQSNESFSMWSPDGSQIAYLNQNVDGDCEIIAKPVIGEGSRRIGSCWKSIVQLYDWSPDGRHIVLSQGPGPQNTMGQLASINITNQKYTVFSYSKLQKSRDYEPRYSPDGKYIAFRRGIQPNMDLYLYDVQKNSATRLTNFNASLKGFSWTASGRHIIFSSNHAGQYDLYAYELEGKKKSRLGIADAANPSVSRKSNVLAFEKLRVKRTILKMTEKGAEAVLKPTTASEQGGKLSPDGGSLGFISNRTGYEELWVVTGSLKENNPVQLTRFNGFRISGIQWSPDGKKIILIAATDKASKLFEIDVNRKAVQMLMQDNIHVKQAWYGKDSNEIFVSARSAGEANVLWRLSNSGDGYTFKATSIPAEDFRYSSQYTLLIADIENKSLDIYDKNLKYIKTIKIPMRPMWWQEKNGFIYFTAVVEEGVGLHRFSLADNTVEKLMSLSSVGLEWTHPWFDISKDEKSIYLTAVERDDTDIAVAELPSWF